MSNKTRLWDILQSDWLVLGKTVMGGGGGGGGRGEPEQLLKEQSNKGD